MTEAEWREAEVGFGRQTLPYCVFAAAGERARVGVGVGEQILDVGPLLHEPAFAHDSLNPFMAMGPAAWRDTRAQLAALLADPDAVSLVGAHLYRRSAVDLRMPLRVADFVDFYSSLEHATNLGRILRPEAPSLPPAWRHLPLGYHGRAGTVVVSGSPVRRPRGVRLDNAVPKYGPSLRLDFEAEVGFVVGVPSSPGESVTPAEFADHVFGLLVVNDWSARDIQSFEYTPLGPFLGKAFATSISPWIVPLAALEGVRRPGPSQDPLPAEHLRRHENWGLDITLEVSLCGAILSRPEFAGMYWTADQQLSHLTSGGASLRTGDLFGSGTVSGPGQQFGSLIELSDNGKAPVRLSDGRTRTFLEDGDTVIVGAKARTSGGQEIRLGAVSGTVLAHDVVE